MRRDVKLVAGAAGLSAALQIMPAVAASFTSQPVVILGNAQVAALGINDSGTIVGSFLNGGPMTGFILQGSTLSFRRVRFRPPSTATAT